MKMIMAGAAGWRIAAAICLSLLLMSCSSSSDVSGSRDFWGGYERGKVYTLNFDVFLMQEPSFGGFAGDYFLTTASEVNMPGSQRATAPYSIHYYKTGEHRPNERGEMPDVPKTLTEDDFEGAARVVVRMTSHEVVGIVEKGTRLRASHLRFQTGWNFMVGAWKSVTVFAEILDGEFAGREVDLSDVSAFAKNRVDGVIVYDPVCVLFCDFRVVN